MDQFIKVTKDGEIIEIHPAALEDHKRLGWKVVEQSLQVEEPPAEKPADKKAKSK